MNGMRSVLAAGLALVAPAAMAACRGVTQVEMTGCAAEAHAAADAELNQVWKEAAAKARAADGAAPEAQPTDFEMLRDAQRAWIPFRDKACAAESTMARGGTMQNQLYFICLERLTRTRTADLRLYVEGLGG